MARRAEQKVTDSMIRGEVYKLLEIAAAQPGWIDRVSTPAGSTHDSEEYANFNHPPIMKPRQSGNTIARPTMETFTLINDEFESGAGIPARMLRRDHAGWYNRYIADIAKRPATHWRKLLTDLLEVGTTTTISSDGDNFFGSAHYYGDQTGQINDVAAAQVADLNVTTPASPTPVELVDLILGCIGYFFGYKDTENEPIWEDNRQFHVMLPHGMAASAAKAFGKELLNNGTGTEENALVGNGTEYAVSYSINRRLTSTTAIYLFVVDTANKGMVRQSEEIPGSGPDNVLVETFGPGSEYFRLNEELLIKLNSSRAVGFTHNWEGSMRATLS